MAFEYTPYRNPYIGTIADLMARGEDAKAKALIDVASAQARAAEAKGQIYGNAIQNIGQSASKALNDYTLEKQNAPIRAAEAAHRAALGEQDIYAAGQRARELATQGREDTARRLYEQRLSSSAPSSTSGEHPYQKQDQNGVWMYDVDSYKRDAAAAGVSVESDLFFKEFNEMNAFRQRTQQEALGRAKSQAGLLLSLPDNTIVREAQTALNGLEGLLPPSQFNAIKDLVAVGDPLAIRKMLEGVSGVVPNLKQFDPTQDVVDANTGRIVRPAAPKVPTPSEIETARHNKELERVATLGAGRAAAVAAETRRHNMAMEAKGPGADGTPSPYALERETRTLNSVDELLSKVNRFTVGYGSLLEGLPESDANAFASELQTLKANIAFNELTAMREASKTGGALGNVSNVELSLLESALGALNTRQSPEQMRSQLEKIKSSINRWQTARGLQTSTPIVLNPSDDAARNAAAAAAIAKARAAVKAKGGQ